MELQLEELEPKAAEDEIAAEQAAANTTNVASFERKRPARQPWPWPVPPVPSARASPPAADRSSVG
jgi:transposase